MVSLIVLPCLRDPRVVVLRRFDDLPALRGFFRAERLVLPGPELQKLLNVLRLALERFRCSPWRSLRRNSGLRNRKREFSKGTPHARWAFGPCRRRNVLALGWESSARGLRPSRNAQRNQPGIRGEWVVRQTEFRLAGFQSVVL